MKGLLGAKNISPFEGERERKRDICDLVKGKREKNMLAYPEHMAREEKVFILDYTLRHETSFPFSLARKFLREIICSISWMGRGSTQVVSIKYISLFYLSRNFLGGNQMVSLTCDLTSRGT